MYIQIIYVYMCTHTTICVMCACPPDPMNHVKIFKVQPRRFALSELVQAWYKTLPPDHFGQVEINDSTMLRNKASTTLSCAEHQILECKILGA